MDDNITVSETQEQANVQSSLAKGLIRLVEKFAPLILGLLISLAVCAPFFKGGYLLLLDWVIGHHTTILSPSFYGLQGGVNASFLPGIVAGIFAHTLGSSATWIPIFLFFPLSCLSIARVIKGNLVAKLASGLFFSINPFVVERLYAGQLGVIYGYLLLPILYGTLDKWLRKEVKTVTHTALVLTFMISIDVHYAWIGGLVVLVAILLCIKDNALRRTIPPLLISVVLLNIYLVIPVLGHPLPVNPTDNQTLLKAFSTRGDPRLGLFVNVLGLYGFWRQMHESSKSLVAGWPILLIAILLLALYGLNTLRKRNEKLALLIAISFVMAYFFSLGSQGPTGSLFTLLYQHLPGFSMMREPEKFSAILATGISLLLGEGLASISLQQASKIAAIIVIAVGVILEIAYNPIIFWGIHGQVKTTDVPSDWTTIASKIDRAQGKTLVLPWHQYMSFPFTQKRIIANPGPGFLSSDVISGDDLQIGSVYSTSTFQRSAYITWLTQNEYNTNNFGKLLAPIGVQYLVIYKTYSTGPTSWISQQKDLKVVNSSNDIELIRNMDFAGLAQILPAPPTMNLQTLLSEANSTQLTGKTNILNILVQNRVSTTSSNTSISYESNKTGWLNLDTPYYPGWRLGGNDGVQSVFGTLTFNVSSNSGTIYFLPWERIIFGYLISSAVLLEMCRRVAFRKA